MSTRKGVNISGNYAAPIYYMPCSYMYFVFSKMKVRTESYSIFFLKLNDHPTRCFNLGFISRIHPNGCMFEVM